MGSIGFAVRAWGRRKEGDYVRHQRFYRGLIVAVLVAGTTMLGCGTALAPATVTASTTFADDLSEDYAVYSALIQKVFIDDYRWSLIVIQDFTEVPDADYFVLGDCLNAIKYQWPELGDDIVSDFSAKVQTPLALERRFDLSVDYTLVGEDEAALGWPGGTGFDAFSKKYPGSLGSVRISRIGFNAAKDTAVLYLDDNAGHVMLLKKTAGGWTVQGEVELWTA